MVDTPVTPDAEEMRHDMIGLPSGKGYVFVQEVRTPDPHNPSRFIGVRTFSRPSDKTTWSVTVGGSFWTGQDDSVVAPVVTPSVAKAAP